VTKLGYSGNLRLTRSQDWYLVNLEIIILHQGWVKRDYVTYLSQLAEVCPHLSHLVRYDVHFCSQSDQEAFRVIVEGLLFSINRQDPKVTRKKILLSCRLHSTCDKVMQDELEIVRQGVLDRVSSAEVSLVEPGGFEFSIKDGQAELVIELAGREGSFPHVCLKDFRRFLGSL